MWVFDLLGLGKMSVEPNWIIRAGTPVSVPLPNGVMSPKFTLPVDFEAKPVGQNEFYTIYKLNKSGELAYIEHSDE